MKFKHACIESLTTVLPEEIWSSAQIEEKLRPVYERLKLPEGRLELMTGIKARRMWASGTRPSDASATMGRSGRVEELQFPSPIRSKAFIHVRSVAATCWSQPRQTSWSFAHHKIGLGPHAQVFDLSNACLGFLNGLVTLGAMIDAGQIRCGTGCRGRKWASAGRTDTAAAAESHR